MNPVPQNERCLRRSGLGAKIAAFVFMVGTLPTILVLGGLVWKSRVISNSVSYNVNKLAEHEAAQMSQNVRDLCRVAHRAAHTQLTATVKLLMDDIKSSGGVKFSDEGRTWSAVNQRTQEAVSISLPHVYVGGRSLGEVESLSVPVPLVDRLKRLTGTDATLFQRMNRRGDMLRVATTVTLKSGRRAVGTYLPAREEDGTINPVLASVLAGKPYEGLLRVMDTSVLIHCEALRDGTGEVVGMISSESVASNDPLQIRDQITQLNLGKSGYVFVLGGRGSQRGRYIISKNGARDGESIWDAKDADGHYFIQDIVAKGLGLRNDQEVAFAKYPWKNKEETTSRMKFAAITYYEPLDWVIGASAYFDELEYTGDHVKKALNGLVMGMALLSIVLLVLLAVPVVWYGRRLAGPLSDMARAAEGIARGNLNQKITYNSNDELGTLAEAFRNLIAYINDVAGAARRLADGVMDVRLTPRSDEDVLSRGFNSALDAIGQVSSEIGHLTLSAQEGRLGVRGDSTRFKGGFASLIAGINATMNALLGPVKETTEVLERLAQKDLTARAVGQYRGEHARIKDAVNGAADSLDRSMTQVAKTAALVLTAAQQIGTGAQSLAEGASKQASSLEEVSSSLQEMNAMTRQSADNAKEARRIADATKESSVRGVERMERMTEAMALIKKSSDDTARIIKTIDEIAFQTNLLALNAAVEAAGAGEAGKGFAVVAEEVRNLAMRSAEAAKNTTDMIQKAVKNAENGVTLNEEVLHNLEEINGHAQRVSEVMSEISMAGDQQRQGIDQVNKATEQMNQLTQQNAANAEESAGSSEELRALAEKMRTMVASFRLTD